MDIFNDILLQIINLPNNIKTEYTEKNYVQKYVHKSSKPLYVETIPCVQSPPYISISSEESNNTTEHLSLKDELVKHTIISNILINDTEYTAHAYTNITKLIINWIHIYNIINITHHGYISKILYCMLTNSVKIADAPFHCFNNDHRTRILIKTVHHPTQKINTNNKSFDMLVIFHFMTNTEYELYQTTMQSVNAVFADVKDQCTFLIKSNILDIRSDYKMLTLDHHKLQIINRIQKKLDKIIKLENDIAVLHDKL